MTNRRIKKSIVWQQDEKDCGVACLRSIFRYYGSDISLEKLRRESGTSIKGTSLLGLYQAACQYDFEAEGFQGSIKDLKELGHPVILHLNLEGLFQHYVICFQYSSGKFTIGDPAQGLSYITPEELEKLWVSGYLLSLRPSKDFKPSGQNTDKSLIWLKENLLEDQSTFIAAIFLGLILAFLGLSTAVFTELLVDDILPHKDFSLLVKAIVSWGLLLLLSNAFNYLRGLLMTRQSFHFNQRVIQYFLSKMLYLPKSFFDSKKQGDMVARLNDSQKIQSAVQYVLTQAIIDMLLLFISFGFLFYYNRETALFALTIIPLLVLLLAVFLQPIKDQQKKVMHQHALNESNYIEMIDGIHSIKTHQKESYFHSKAQQTYNRFQGSIYSFNTLALRFDLSNDLLNTSCLILTIAFGSFLYFEQKIQLGELLAALTIVGILISSVENLVLANINIQGAKVALERMLEFTEEETEFASPPHPIPLHFQKMEIQNLSFSYPGQGNLLKEISFTVPKGEILSILGENGCGKSTLIQILQKFYTSYSGNILINNKNQMEIPTSSWRNIIGVVPQQIKIFNGSLLDNICMEEGEKKEEQIITFCKHYGFHSFFSKLHHGYRTLVGEEGINLSGGEKQMLALARALYRNPQILILDEATSAMDRNTEQFVLKLLKQLKGEKTILFITHRLHILKAFDGRILIMEDGRIKANGNHESLLAGTNLYSKYWKDLLYA